MKAKSGCLRPEGFSYPVFPRSHHGTTGQASSNWTLGVWSRSILFLCHLMPRGHAGLTQPRCWCCSPCPSKENNLGREPELVGSPKAPLAIPLENRLLLDLEKKNERWQKTESDRSLSQGWKKKSLYIPTDYISLIYIRTHMPRMSKKELLNSDSSAETTEDTRDTLSTLKESS